MTSTIKLEDNGGNRPPLLRSTANVDHWPDEAVYLDTPILSVLHQLLPFYEDGIFGSAETPLFLRMKPVVRAQLLATRLPQKIDIRRFKGGQAGRLPIAPGAVLFYPFNSQSNMNAVTNRSLKHVLTLHGESNKLASVRPASRLYDYVCVAGPLAQDRYLEAGIFTRADIDSGRLVMMGDSFVQNMPWLRAAQADDDGVVLYCPTWEGYGNGPDNYSSVRDQRGFLIAAEAARALDTKTIVIRPHPYLGLWQPRLQTEFFSGARHLLAQGFTLKLALSDASTPTRILCRMFLPRAPWLSNDDMGATPIRLGICDVSGMEAVFLKHQIPHMVIGDAAQAPARLHDFYHDKTLTTAPATKAAVSRYMPAASQIDAEHRGHAFAYQDPAIAGMPGADRRKWLMDYVKADPFWQAAPAS